MRTGHDKDPAFVGVPTIKPHKAEHPALPRDARLPINRCSVPADILGGLTFQRHPVALTLDGVLELHQRLFRRLDGLSDAAERAQLFMAHMAAAFSLDEPEAAGWSAQASHDRSRMSYLKSILGWAFDSDGIEGAVLKGWVESRFGLLPRHHGGPIRDLSGEPYRRYLEMRAQGLYGTNGLEAQLDLLYSYCQYELGRQRAPRAAGAPSPLPRKRGRAGGEGETARCTPPTHITLYRGINHVSEHETLLDLGQGRRVMLLNNLSSFSAERERADEFGDFILEVSVPLAKIVFYPQLLPGMPKGEDEYAVIGGLYEVGYSML
ncbi:MAG: NAD(+)--dinitrogen-reductase ADP-D-ribosyltransferase [Betaproteobacteria bacterium]|nr:NAD(+)--dinitrogen-reductase ADP-D-ribosyltransferase [Betaproteobacteria bacterium]